MRNAERGMNNLETLIDSATVLNRIQRDRAVGMVNPEQHAPVPDPVFLQPLQVSREVFHGLVQQFRMSAQPFQLLRDVTSDWRVEPFKGSVKGGGALKPVGHTRLLAGWREWANLACEVLATGLPEPVHQSGLTGDEVVFQFSLKRFEVRIDPQDFVEDTSWKRNSLAHFPHNDYSVSHRRDDVNGQQIAWFKD